MFADSLQSRRPIPDYERAFVDEVNAREMTPPDPKVERIILICWFLIAIKHVAVIWAVYHYAIPFHQLWVNAPTWIFGTAATVVYYYFHRRD